MSKSHWRLNVPLDDADAYKVFADANTTAVFQFESVGMKNAQRSTPK
jgi:DNA polymerase III alpha subunit